MYHIGSPTGDANPQPDGVKQEPRAIVPRSLYIHAIGFTPNLNSGPMSQQMFRDDGSGRYTDILTRLDGIRDAPPNLFIHPSAIRISSAVASDRSWFHRFPSGLAN